MNQAIGPDSPSAEQQYIGMSISLTIAQSEQRLSVAMLDPRTRSPDRSVTPCHGRNADRVDGFILVAA
jgi:hypothetical protein